MSIQCSAHSLNLNKASKSTGIQEVEEDRWDIGRDRFATGRKLYFVLLNVFSTLKLPTTHYYFGLEFKTLLQNLHFVWQKVRIYRGFWGGSGITPSRDLVSCSSFIEQDNTLNGYCFCFVENKL